MKTLVYGAGAIGSWLTAELTKANHDVCLLARGENLRNLQANGVKYREIGSEQFIVPFVVLHLSPLKKTSTSFLLR